MTKPLIRIHNLQTDEVIDREMNDEEFEAYELQVANAEKRQVEAETKTAARQAILDRLGLTEEEARLLLG